MAEIVRTDDVLGGDPRIDGTRVGVHHGYGLVVAGDHDPADVADQLDLVLAEDYSALASFYAKPAEMRAIRRADETAEVELADRSLTPPTTAQ